MSTSKNKKTIKTSFIYLCISVFCAFFGAVYERFSHEVYSYYMIYAFAIPLILGALVFSLIEFLGLPEPDKSTKSIYGFGISSLTVGSIMKGVLDIYGTTNKLLVVYLYVGLFFFGFGVSDYIIENKHKQNREV